ncbi:MAG TPA: FCD domain-containing protein [Hypericibacter adhaerens]|jgi:DNA-binding FadR family transcriptional regulator|uniref:GntR family transcriptional regulator n=1 Tax=Hypericibacter adhaerens TaxID=2602016 RepID=A0A5J6N1U7_9PROT|nr:FCD domain-containing protein [Hypericibacter adhaerens]QEX23938.1 GntR family transcriptional regulator [Hypericibacter adhaerens]HWA44534.1 FCD domain-containing protein [Hypericibacter adhaerens]
MEAYEQTAARLRQLISDGDIGEDGRIPPERVLASELGVGRRSLRRALEILESEGRISRQQGRGTFIQASPFTAAAAGAEVLDNILEHTNPQEVIELRLATEPVIARLAALRASQCDIKKLQRLAAETRAAAGAESYEQADQAFHRAVVEASRNALFLAVFDAVGAARRDEAWRRVGENAHCFKRQAVHADFHAEIVAAIAARDGERAQSAMYRHLSDIQQHILRHAFSLHTAPVAGAAQ